MKKLIIASIIASASFTSQAASVIRVCDTTVSDFRGEVVSSYEEKNAVVTDSGIKFSFTVKGSGKTMSSPSLLLSDNDAHAGLKDGIFFVRLNSGEAYAAGMESLDLRITLLNCTKGRSA